MTHPEPTRVTAWVHDLLGPEDARAVADHAAACGPCGELAARLKAEARVLTREIARKERLNRLKEELAARARALGAPSGGRRHRRGLVLQLTAAAALVAGLVFFLLPSRPRHSLVRGRVALEDGREVSAPAKIPAVAGARLHALEEARLELAGGSTVDLRAGARLLVQAGGRAELDSGEAEFTAPADGGKLVVSSNAGRVETARGRFLARSLDPKGGASMKTSVKGMLVTVLGGSICLASPNGTIEASAGQSALLAPSQAPLLLTPAQESPERLLARLEELAASVARLEQEVSRLERENARLQARLLTDAPDEVETTKRSGTWDLESYLDHLGHARVGRYVPGDRLQCAQCHSSVPSRGGRLQEPLRKVKEK